ncbi:porin family protein [Phenylobacterium deserti]|nr:porin family protein [Phenylobacterium deserti]
MLKLSLVLAAATCVVVPEVAGAQIYGSIGYAQSDFGFFPEELGAVQGRVGWKANRFLALEGEGAIGLNKETFDVPTVPPMSITNKIDNQLAAYVVGVVPVTGKIDLFGRAGYGRTEMKRGGNQNGQTYSYTTSDESWNYGVGGEYRLTDKDGVRLDWTRHEFDGPLRADQWSISYQRRFR